MCNENTNIEKQNSTEVLRITDLVELYSTKLDIPKIKIDTILKTYIQLCKQYLNKGVPISIPNICVLEDKNKETTMYISTGYILQEISTQTNYPILLVNTVISSMFQDIKRSLIIENKPVELRGLVTLKPKINEDNSLSIHVATSSSIRNKNTELNHIRAYTCSWLRQGVKA